MSITLEHIATKMRATRPIHNMAGVRITLTNQQRAVVRAVCLRGMTIKEFAKELGESPDALKHVYESARVLAGCKNQGQLGAWAARQGLV